MADYTLDMFLEDQDELPPILEMMKGIELPKDEWPKLNIDSTIYSINPHFPEVDTVGYFRTKYGRDKGNDYSFRFLTIVWFIRKKGKALFKEGFIRKDEKDGSIMVDGRILRVMLDSYQPPVPPSIFSTSYLQEQHGVFVLERVLEAVENLSE